MHGTVWEWGDDTVKAADGALHRVLRGGSWTHDSGSCRAADRRVFPPSCRFSDLGLRVARVPVGMAAAATNLRVDDAWFQHVAALPPAEQVKEVSEKLQARNTGFDGRIKHTIDQGVVKGLQFNVDKVTDLAPLRALKGLESLEINRKPAAEFWKEVDDKNPARKP